MITYDKTYKQVLSSACKQCISTDFERANETLENVGCCSYSPVFTLFELKQAVKFRLEDFFCERIIGNDRAELGHFEVTVHAFVNDDYDTEDDTELSLIEQADKKLSYSVCAFFKSDVGCSLHPALKNAICRSFICTAIEKRLSAIQQKELHRYIHAVHKEARTFHQRYANEFSKKGWKLEENVEEIIAYFKKIL